MPPVPATAGASIPATLVEIYVLTGPNTGQKLGRFDPEGLRIGSRKDCDLSFGPDERAVAEVHAELLREGPDYVLTDLGSPGGTWLWPQGERITRRRLNQRTQVQFGRGGPLCLIQVGVTVPFGRYLVTGYIGGGGMAEVFAARGPGGLSRSVAIKVIRLDKFGRKRIAEMFVSEARIAAEVKHHNVVKIYDVGEEHGVLYIVMDHLRGVSLQIILDEMHRRQIILPPDLAAALVSQALGGLHAAHELRDEEGRPMRVVHRDVSPSNLLCTPEGLVIVIDFGVAHVEQPLTHSSREIKGKPSYMAPEQVRAEPVDRRVDIFAAALVLFELCTGRAIFKRDTIVATLNAVLEGKVPPLASLCPQVPKRLQRIVHQALSPSPAGRPETAAIFATELDLVVREAGGRFTHLSAIAAYLTGIGLPVQAPPPAPLAAIPTVFHHSEATLAEDLTDDLISGDDPSPPAPVPSPTTLVSPPAPAPPPPAPASPPPAPASPLPAPVPPLSLGAPPPVLTVPPEGPAQEQRAPSGHMLSVSTLWVDPLRQREPLRLPLPQGPHLLPAPLWIATRANALVLELDSPPGRLGIYEDAHDPDTRYESYVLSPVLQGGRFEVGHRRRQLQTVYYSSGYSHTGPAPLTVQIPLLGLALHAPWPAQRLVALHTADRKTGAIHVACVLVRG